MQLVHRPHADQDAGRGRPDGARCDHGQSITRGTSADALCSQRPRLRADECSPAPVSSSVVSLCQLHNPLAEEGTGLAAENALAYTCHRLERAWKALGLGATEAHGYLVTELNPTVGATPTVQSTRARYAEMCRRNIRHTIERKPRFVVACGKHTQKGWREFFDGVVALPAGVEVVSAVTKVGPINEERTVQGTLSVAAEGETSLITVLFAQHPRHRHHTPFRHLVLALREAHSLATGTALPISHEVVENAGVTGIASITQVNRSPAVGEAPFTYVQLKVDGDQRFVLGNGILTHSQ